jgi:hypothetical protein
MTNKEYWDSKISKEHKALFLKNEFMTKKKICLKFIGLLTTSKNHYIEIIRHIKSIKENPKHSHNVMMQYYLIEQEKNNIKNNNEYSFFSEVHFSNREHVKNLIDLRFNLKMLFKNDYSFMVYFNYDRIINNLEYTIKDKNYLNKQICILKNLYDNDY